jgi:hypothetical protein
LQLECCTLVGTGHGEAQHENGDTWPRLKRVTGAIFSIAPYRSLADPLERLLAYIEFRKGLL